MMEDRLQDSGTAHGRAPFEHLSRSKVKAVVNCLTESCFFYREDDPDLFEYLRRQRAEFARFFEDWFGWDLHVDRKVARLFKPAPHNPALTPKQRHLFDLTRRDECLLFMLLLEFHERELARLNVHHEHDEDLRFELADFVAFALDRYRRELGERAPGDRELFGSVQSLFRELERHRFIEAVERAQLAAGEALPAGQTERVLYAFRAGIRCYDPERLSDSIFAQSFGASPVDADAENASLEDAGLGLVAEEQEEGALGRDADASEALLDTRASPEEELS